MSPNDTISEGSEEEPNKASKPSNKKISGFKIPRKKESSSLN
jgi:hypothetical protein